MRTSARIGNTGHDEEVVEGLAQLSEEGSEPEDERKKDKTKAKGPREEPTSKPLRQVTADEDRTLRDWLLELGTEGSFRVQLKREKPVTVRVNGKEMNAHGYLETYDGPVTEEQIRDKYGGGTYSLKVTKRTEGGSYVYAKHRTIQIAGDPNPDSVPNAIAPPPGPVTNPAGSDKIVEKAFDVMREQIRNVPREHEISPAVQRILDDARDRERATLDRIDRLQAELADARREPAERSDPFRDKLMSSLLDGNASQVTALQIRHEAELRQLKQSHIDEESRLRDRADRDMAATRASYEREIAAIKQSNEVALMSAKAAFDTQAMLLKNDNQRLERTVEELRAEVRELRARKEKTVAEQIKEMNSLKELISDSDDSGEKSAWDKIGDIVASPAAGEIVGRLFGGADAKAQAAAQAQVAAQAQAAQTAAAARRRPTVVRDPKGQRFVQSGNQLIPVKPKPKIAVPAVVGPNGETVSPAVVAPEVSAEQLGQLVGYLEKAYEAKTDPDIVAQSGRSIIPPDILTWIKHNTTEEVNGVDLFMTTVAKLPSTSPLAQLGGKNWLRRVGKALVG